MCATSWSRARAASCAAPPWNRPEYEPSKRKLTWPNGAVAHCYGADEPALLRGPQHKKGWVDELASFRYDEALDNFLLGLRLGDHPQAVVTTTPDRAGSSSHS